MWIYLSRDTFCTILYNFHRALIEIELSFVILLKIGKELGRGD